MDHTSTSHPSRATFLIVPKMKLRRHAACKSVENRALSEGSKRRSSVPAQQDWSTSGYFLIGFPETADPFAWTIPR